MANYAQQKWFDDRHRGNFKLLSEISINFEVEGSKPQIIQGVHVEHKIDSPKISVETKKRSHSGQYICKKCKKVPTYDKRGTCQKCLVKERTESAKSHDFIFKKGPKTSRVVTIEKCPKSDVLYGHHWVIIAEQGSCKFCGKTKDFKRRTENAWTKAPVQRVLS